MFSQLFSFISSFLFLSSLIFHHRFIQYFSPLISSLLTLFTSPPFPFFTFPSPLLSIIVITLGMGLKCTVVTYGVLIKALMRSGKKQVRSVFFLLVFFCFAYLISIFIRIHTEIMLILIFSTIVSIFIFSLFSVSVICITCL